MRILIADSGASKTDWAYIQNGKPVYMKSTGLHPAYLDRNKMLKELKKIFSHTDPSVILFYGAGCYSDESSRPVRLLLNELFASASIEIYDDLIAVAHAFLGNESGIAGILGTGSGSGYFSGGKMKKQVTSLGYILGDEGSGADIGRRLLKGALRKNFNTSVLEYIQSRIGNLDYPDIVSNLYNSKRPSYYLADVAGKVLSGDYPDVFNQLVEESFQSFVDNHLKEYESYTEVKIVLSGGTASHLASQLSKVLERNKITNYEISGGAITALAERKIAEMNR
jgi:glucosamine kinase